MTVIDMVGRFGTGGESRQDLLIWINDLLQLGYTKVEQCGSGAAHCQIMDSIYRDVAMSKVKFNAKHEYEYVQNFKVLQNIFEKHKIDNHIPVERLIKSKFQDNLEFLQWLKKYWDQYYPGGTYDALARRKGAASRKAAAGSPVRKATSSASVASNGSRTIVEKTSAAARVSVPKRAPASEPALALKEKVNELSSQNSELKVTVDQVEKEREFYFTKLREIEVCVQNAMDAPGVEQPLASVLKEIQAIMYQTEDGFEVPAGSEEEMF
ncbi:MAG: hypothetical protein SGCHY_004482 [Lobulomycetales sp.]